MIRCTACGADLSAMTPGDPCPGVRCRYCGDRTGHDGDVCYACVHLPCDEPGVVGRPVVERLPDADQPEVRGKVVAIGFGLILAASAVGAVAAALIGSALGPR